MSTAFATLCGTTANRPAVATFLHSLLITGNTTRALCAVIALTATRHTRSNT